MDKQKGNKFTANIVLNQDGIELKSVKNIPEQSDNVENRITFGKEEDEDEDEIEDEVSIDMPDRGCGRCDVESVDENQSTSESDEYASEEIGRKSNHLPFKGLMDFALLNANVNQLRFLISYNSEEQTYVISVTLILLSLIMQVLVGIGMILKRRMKNKGLRKKAHKMGSLVICGLFCLAVINFLVVSFTTTTTTVYTDSTVGAD